MERHGAYRNWRKLISRDCCPGGYYMSCFTAATECCACENNERKMFVVYQNHCKSIQTFEIERVFVMKSLTPVYMVLGVVNTWKR